MKQSNKTENRGGVRTSLTKKIGRPKEEPKKVLFRRVPEKHFEEIKTNVDNIINSYKTIK